MDQSRGNSGDFPVDDATYNLMQSLVSKLEALDTYQTYIEDAEGEDRQLFQELIDEDRQHAQRLLEAVKRRLGNA